MRHETKRKIRRTGLILFLCYLLGLTYFLFFAESYGRTLEARDYSYNLVPFLEIRRFWENREVLGNVSVFINLAGNVLAFVPYGFFLPMMGRYARGFFRMALFTFEFSLLVEVIQLVSRVGSFDVDDLILNTLGGILGYLLFTLCNHMRRKVYGEK
jgi:glycopeptide antibiotics resistance protein